MLRLRQARQAKSPAVISAIFSVQVGLPQAGQQALQVKLQAPMTQKIEAIPPLAVVGEESQIGDLRDVTKPEGSYA